MPVRQDDELDVGGVEPELLQAGNEHGFRFLRVVERVEQDQAGARVERPGAHLLEADVVEVVEDLQRFDLLHRPRVGIARRDRPEGEASVASAFRSSFSQSPWPWRSDPAPPLSGRSVAPQLRRPVRRRPLLRARVNRPRGHQRRDRTCDQIPALHICAPSKETPNSQAPTPKVLATLGIGSGTLELSGCSCELGPEPELNHARRMASVNVDAVGCPNAGLISITL